MSLTARVNTTQFERAMVEMVKLTGESDSKIIFNTAKFLMPKLAFFTFLMTKKRNRASTGLLESRAKHSKGRARLGWYPAWKYLGTKGAPRVGEGPLIDRGEGGIIDKSKKIIDPYITVFNEVPYILESEKKRNTVPRALNAQASYMFGKIDQAYSRILKGKSG
jgi:hypothetical protein